MARSDSDRATVLSGGAEGTRTPNPLDATEVRYQLRYSPWSGVKITIRTRVGAHRPSAAEALRAGAYSPEARRRARIASRSKPPVVSAAAAGSSIAGTVTSTEIISTASGAGSRRGAAGLSV